MTPTTVEPLAPQLQAVKEKFLSSLPKEAVAKVNETSAKLEQSKPINPLQVGDQAPDFTLPNAKGEKVTLSELLKDQSAVVITWYRGGWCPYCNMTLRVFTQHNDEIEGLGAKLVALTPETADESLSMAEKNELKFEVLSDDGLSVADKFGVMFTVPDDIKKMYTGFGIDLDNINGNEGKRMARLPAPATYVIDKKGVIQYAFADLDYTKRAEPSEVMKVLKKLAA
ncbi:alkyl hydroperoxide reductase [Gracilaria domingensis]|nr:alkyl hydroperoxide reductase [Gracilaria domingensis]